MDLTTAVLLAGQAAEKQQSPLGSIVLFLPLIAIFYFLMIRPQQKRTREHKAMTSELKQGDRVVAAGGLIGTIRRIDDTTLSLQVADNVVLKVDRASVSKRLADE